MVIGTFHGAWSEVGGLRIDGTVDRGALSSCGLDIASDGTAGTNPNDTIELYTEPGSVTTD